MPTLYSDDTIFILNFEGLVVLESFHNARHKRSSLVKPVPSSVDVLLEELKIPCKLQASANSHCADKPSSYDIFWMFRLFDQENMLKCLTSAIGIYLSARIQYEPICFPIH